MKCVKCGGEMRCVDTAKGAAYHIRARVCTGCKHELLTIEGVLNRFDDAPAGSYKRAYIAALLRRMEDRDKRINGDEGK